MRHEKYEEALQQIKEIYFSIGALRCPVLNGELIYFNQQGFRHLLRKGKYPRPIPDQFRRFRLFRKYVVKIISSEQSLTKKIQREVIGRFYTVMRMVGNNIKISIIIIRNRNGSLCFLSIMDNKQK